jgi:hypothetical protein
MNWFLKLILGPRYSNVEDFKEETFEEKENRYFARLFE